MKRGLPFCLESGDFLWHFSACLFEFIRSYIISLTPMGLRDTCSSTGGVVGYWKVSSVPAWVWKLLAGFSRGLIHHNPKTEVCPVTKLDLKSVNARGALTSPTHFAGELSLSNAVSHSAQSISILCPLHCWSRVCCLSPLLCSSLYRVFVPLPPFLERD